MALKYFKIRQIRLITCIILLTEKATTAKMLPKKTQQYSIYCPIKTTTTTFNILSYKNTKNMALQQPICCPKKTKHAPKILQYDLQCKLQDYAQYYNTTYNTTSDTTILPTILQHYNTIALQQYSTSVLQYDSPRVLQYYSSTLHEYRLRV